MHNLFRRHRSKGSESAGDKSSDTTFPEPIAADRKGSAGSGFIFDRPCPPPSNQRPLIPPDPGSNSSLRSLSPSRQTSLGLHVEYQPSATSCLDIVFIHGLGGDSRKTWSRDHKPELFWPGLWLPLETELERARIFTFGYNATFGPGKAKNVASVTDFAKELLFELRFGKTHKGENFGIGETPLIFVTHSMGGLVAKKACLLGQNDEHYKALVRSISAIIFLSTPHRGSNLAEILNRILVASFQSARNFITDLNRSSTALEEINEQFRHIAPRLSIWSFYETLPTPIGPRKMMVLEKDSAILGYTKEISRPLYADHHGVCKYSSTEDANYVSIRNALGTLAEEIARKVGVSADQAMDEFQKLQGLFSSFLEHDDDLNKYNRFYIEGTCQWILLEDGMSDWIGKPEGCHLIWFSAAPASGKSVLSAYVVTALQQRSLAPQYFFFNYGDQHKRSIAHLLRSIACQIAKENRTFRRGLLDLSKQGLRVDKADASVIWHKVYENLLFKMEHRRPFFWVIDALDECDSPKLLLDLTRTCSRSVPLRIFITSRQTESIQMGVTKVARSLHLTKLEKHSLDHNAQGIQRLVEQEVGHMRGSEQIKDLVVQKILARAEGNFLWTRLVLEEIVYCHTASGIQETLDEFPSDMQRLYERMEHAILELPRKSSRLLAKALLRWTMGARRPMSVRELSQALEPDFPEILDLKRTISDVCGQFIRVDASDYVAMMHLTAREYLVQPRETELYIDVQANHEALCIKTVSALLDSRITSDMIDSDAASQSYLLYAATSWMYHLKASKSGSGSLLDVLVRFFDSGAFPLWVHLLSRTSHLDVLMKTSKSLASFVKLVRKEDASKNSLLRRLSDLQLLDQWAVDLIRIVAKFSTSLLKYPRAIYGLVSPFSPETSALYQQPYCKNDRDLCVVGDLDIAWTDRLARISLPEGFEAYKLACAGQYVAALGGNGRIFVWDFQTFMEAHVVEHGEPVTSFVLNAQGNKLATYGLKTTKLWAIPSGEVLCSVSNNVEARAITLFLTNNDTRILAGFNDSSVRFFDVGQNKNEWRYVHQTLFKEPLTAEAGANSPTCVAFSRDGLYAGVAYRGFPLSIWSLETGECINRCKRSQGTNFSADQYAAGWCVAWRFVWNPVTDHVIGFCRDGFVFKWHPLTGEHQEAQAYANDVAASSDGKLFMSSTTTGIVKVWDFVDFSIIYQLASDDLLIGLAFSPDCLRFFDLRCGSVNSINAWEPNSLLRFSDAEEAVSDLASETAIPMSVAQASEARLEQFEAISALAACPNGKCFCVGSDDGSVQLRSTNGSDKVEVGKFNNFMEVRHLAWSQNSRYIVAVDLSGAIMLSQIEMTDYGHLTETTQIIPLQNPKLHLEGQAIHEVLFGPGSSMLLIVASQSGHVWSLEDANLRASEKLADGNLRKWVSHPTHHELLLGIGSTDVRVVGWQNLLECREPVSYLHMHSLRQDNLSISDFNGDVDMATNVLKRTNIVTRGPSSEKVRAMVTQDLKYVLIRLSANDTFIGSGRFFILPLAELEPIRAGVNQTDISFVRSATIPDDVRSRVRIALAILPGDRFVFLDWNWWVSSYKMVDFGHQSASAGISSKPPEHHGKEGDKFVQRHYFVPDDWITGGSLDLCCMTADGTLIYPRDDKVSMVRADLNRPALWRGSSAFRAGTLVAT
ncbi:WD40 repeat-containing protein [Usnea florida]